MIQNYPILTTGVYSKIETRVYQDTLVPDIYWICSAFLTSTGSVTIEKRRFWAGVDINGLGPVESITQPDNLTYIDIDVVDSVSECQFAFLTATVRTMIQIFNKLRKEATRLNSKISPEKRNSNLL